MNGETRILVLEDSLTDAEICEYEIKKEIPNCVFLRVETEEKYRKALEEFKPDLILSDYWLPRFTGMEALKIALLRDKELPFIVVTGSMNEETAVACMKAGAWDYVIKEHMKRLGKAVKAALEQKEMRRKRKGAEEERARLAAAVEQAGEIIFITDREGTIIYANPALEEVTGYSREEVLGKNPRIFKSGRHGEVFYQNLWDTITAGRTWRGRVVNRKKDGTLYTEEATISPIRGETGEITHFVAVKRDVTEFLTLQEEKERLQVQFIQAQKMESIGRLAGGIAHDFNNMLGVIIGHAEVAMAEMEEKSSIYQHLQEIRKAAERSAELTRQLLAFARRQPIEPKVLNINEVVKEMVSMLRRITPENIDLTFEAGENLWPVKADPTQINRLLVNLVTNARDAIRETGHIRLATANRKVDEAFCQGRPFCRIGEYVEITVSDDGIGMEEEMLSCIFEPFFTTKPAGEGTGMGLSIVYGIVKQHDGFIDVKSEPGFGTVFSVYLPRYKGKEMPEGMEKKMAASTAGEGEIILLVEDEVELLEIGRILCERLGYRVLAASSPREALELAERYRGKINLLITDMIMPGMNGVELAKRIQKICPDVRCILSSGYGAASVLPRESMEFLEKPYTIETLAAKIKAVLRGREGKKHG
jgi:PAS domain S-box-containing protein